ncbi:MAG: hypothetical protein CM15mV137_290 [uncultured marine virus]|nr:MAG: hypothetical protein CM15mV137_290 [uncultured marine virus]
MSFLNRAEFDNAYQVEGEYYIELKETGVRSVSKIIITGRL